MKDVFEAGDPRTFGRETAERETRIGYGRAARFALPVTPLFGRARGLTLVWELNDMAAHQPGLRGEASAVGPRGAPRRCCRRPLDPAAATPSPMYMLPEIQRSLARTLECPRSHSAAAPALTAYSPSVRAPSMTKSRPR